MQFKFDGRCVVTFEHTEGEKTSRHIATDFNLEVSDNLDKSKYLDKNDLPTSEGTKALTNVFVQALVGNIHQAHQNGFWDSAEHLRYIIKELERGFAEPATATEGHFDT